MSAQHRSTISTQKPSRLWMTRAPPDIAGEDITQNAYNIFFGQVHSRNQGVQYRVRPRIGAPMRCKHWNLPQQRIPNTISPDNSQTIIANRVATPCRRTMRAPPPDLRGVYDSCLALIAGSLIHHNKHSPNLRTKSSTMESVKGCVFDENRHLSQQ